MNNGHIMYISWIKNKADSEDTKLLLIARKLPRVLAVTKRWFHCKSINTSNYLIEYFKTFHRSD
jgi:hypothetical protein